MSQTRVGMRWTQQRQARIGNRRAGLETRERSSGGLTNGALPGEALAELGAAYGKIVLFWHPDAGAKFAEARRPNRA